MASKKALTQVKDIREGKDEALKAALAQIQKEFGQGSIMTLGDDRKRMNIETISTGSISLDLATGIGGIAKGRIAEIYGPESSGKTTLTLHIIAEAQKNGGKAAFIDAEHALDPEYAENLGVNIDELIVSQPDTGEQALEICEMLVRSGALDVVVIDSVAALVPKAEIEGAMGDSVVGLQARLMSQALRKLAAIINKSNTSVIFINQLREKIGIMYGSPEVTTGGKALKFYASMRFDVRRVETIKKGDEMLGNRVKVKIVKNKLAPPFKQAEFEIMYGEGISKMGDIIDSAINVNIIDKSGSWYSFKGTRLGQGKENVKAFLKENPKLSEMDLEHYIVNISEAQTLINPRYETSVELLADVIDSMGENFAGVVLSVNSLQGILFEAGSGNHKDPYVIAVKRIFELMQYRVFAQTDETSVPLLANALTSSMNQSELETLPRLSKGQLFMNIAGVGNLVFNQQLLQSEVQRYGGIQ